MTPEEAGQIILEGEPWITCDWCDGDGKSTVYDRECGWCKGYGVVLKKGYIAACDVLQRPFPSLPTRRWPPGGAGADGAVFVEEYR